MTEPRVPGGRPAAGRPRRTAERDDRGDEGEDPMKRIGRTLITGGASGLGAAVAEAVLASGGRPLVLDKNAPPESLGLTQGVDAVRADLADARATAEAVDELAAAAGGLDAVVTAAGTDACGPLGAIPPEQWERVVQVNLVGTASAVRAALPLLSGHGKVVTVASTLGLRAVGDATAYCASKHGIVGFTRALAAECAGDVGVTLLVPGGMDTAFFDGRDEQYRPGPETRLNDPADVADAVLFALAAPPGCEVREMVVCPSKEGSWP